MREIDLGQKTVSWRSAVAFALICLAVPLAVGVAFGQDVQTVAVPEPTEDAIRYYRSGNVLWVVETLWSLIIPALILFTGASARIRNGATAIGRKWFFVVGVYFVIFVLVFAILNAPLSFYAEFVREHAFGLSNQTFGEWLQASLIGLAVISVVGVLFIWIPYLLIRKSTQRWWLYSGVALIPFAFFMAFVQPIWIAPLFNDFGPMQDRELEARILALADRAGIEDSRVYEVDMSAETNAVNAYVRGFAGTHRIVLWDTIIEQLKDDELDFVMGHEMGHYVLGHVSQAILVSAAFVTIALYVVYRTAAALIRRYHERFGFTELGDVASLPLLILLGQLAFLVLAPAALAFSRYQEHEADRFGLELTQDSAAAGRCFVALIDANLGYPRPGLIVKLWRGTHPSIAERIEFANSYHPWETGEPLVYGDLFDQRE